MKITELNYRNRNFTIALEDGWYLAIEDKYITDGRLNTTLNGLQMHADKKRARCIEMTKQAVDIDYYESIGMSKTDAFIKAMNIQCTPEMREAIKEFLS